MTPHNGLKGWWRLKIDNSYRGTEFCEHHFQAKRAMVLPLIRPCPLPRVMVEPHSQTDDETIGLTNSVTKGWSNQSSRFTFDYLADLHLIKYAELLKVLKTKKRLKIYARQSSRTSDTILTNGHSACVV